MSCVLGMNRYSDHYTLMVIEIWCYRNEGLNSSATSGTFLVEDGPYYYCMLEILLGRLSKSLYNQVRALDKELCLLLSLLGMRL